MSRATDTPSTEPSSTRPALGATVPAGKVVCPFCGSVNDRPSHDYDNTACPRCTMADTPATRQATRLRLGPWFVRQNRNPAAPGMKFETLMGLVKRGQVTAQSVVRGPTTGQFWRFASQVKGLSREFGVCYNCATPVDKAATICPQCNRMQEPPANPDVLLENAPTAAAATAPVTSPTTPAPPTPVHREIKPAPAPTGPAPSPSPVATPAFATATAAVATADEPAPSRSRGGSSSRREAPPMRGEGSSQRTDLLAPSTRTPRPLPSKQRVAEDGILSARDLATAFQLDFNPPAHRGAGGPVRVLLVAILLAVSAGAILLIVNPDYRDRTRIWLNETSTALRTAVTGRTASPVPVTPRTGLADNSASQSAGPATQSSPATTVEPPSASEPTPVARPAETEIKPVVPETKTAAATPQVTIAPVPTPLPPATRSSPQPKVTTPPPVTKIAAAPIDAAKASEQALTLWRQALDAEARRDDAKAIEHYEAIKKLPRSTWPSALEINLALAKKRVK